MRGVRFEETGTGVTYVSNATSEQIKAGTARARKRGLRFPESGPS